MRVVFLGNHPTAVVALHALHGRCEVRLVVTHPRGAQTSASDEAVWCYATQAGIPARRLGGTDSELLPEIERLCPDLLWCTNYRYKLCEKALGAARSGAVNLHPSLLPRYRGRAPINWAILQGERTLGLTAHFMNSDIDAGDVIEQMSYELSAQEDVSHALRKISPLYGAITHRALDHFEAGAVPRRPQDESEASWYGARCAADGAIDWTGSATCIANQVRALTRPYPGAFTFLDDRKLLIWRAGAFEGHARHERPGLVTNASAGTFTVTCGQGSLRVERAELSGSALLALPAGTRLGAPDCRPGARHAALTKEMAQR